MTDSESDVSAPSDIRRRVMTLLYTAADTNNSTFSIRELAAAVNTDPSYIIAEIEQHSDLFYDREHNTVQAKRPNFATGTKALPWETIEAISSVKKPKHRRPLGKSSDIRSSLGDTTMGRVGYVCVADEFLLEELEKYYSDQGYYTKCDYDVLHVRFSDKELTKQQQQQQQQGQVSQQTSHQGYGGTQGQSSSQPVAATSSSTGPTRKVGFDLFIFQYGAIVWWGFDQKFFKIVENDFMFPSSKITKFILNRYKTQIINEIYPVWCSYSLVKKDTLEPDDDFKERLLFDHFLIPYSAIDVDTSSISMLCASHALAQSAKIDYLEIKIQDLTQSCKPLPRELKEQGHVTITERRLLQLRGEVLSYRLMLKSGSDLLDEPELFWQNAYLKPIFQATKECFEITERVRALDTKLDADNEILSMITEQFNQRHGARLEWIVIWLVLVEVIIGVLELLLDVKPWVR